MTWSFQAVPPVLKVLSLALGPDLLYLQVYLLTGERCWQGCGILLPEVSLLEE